MYAYILETERLLLREYTLEDAPFLLRLVNNPSWLQFIGDRKVYSLQDAEQYLSDSIKKYEQYGFGFGLVSIKESGEPIGSCGLTKRDYLDDIDIGFALLPEYTGNGYAYEIAEKTLEYALDILGIRRIVAITTMQNEKSIRLLKKIGLSLEKQIRQEEEDLYLFSYEVS